MFISCEQKSQVHAVNSTRLNNRFASFPRIPVSLIIAYTYEYLNIIYYILHYRELLVRITRTRWRLHCLYEYTLYSYNKLLNVCVSNEILGIVPNKRNIRLDITCKSGHSINLWIDQNSYYILSFYFKIVLNQKIHKH